MASSNLQGLNLVHPESPPSNLTDAQDLLSTPLFPDLAAHLDLWTNVNFASDEPFISARDRQLKEAETETSHADSLTRKEAAHHFTDPAPSPVSANALPQNHQFDFQRFLAEFGIPPSSEGLNLQNVSGMPGLAQPDFAATPNSFGAVPSAAPAPAASASASATTIRPAQSEVTSAPAPKRARTSTTKAAASSAPSPTTSLPDSSEPNTTTPLSASEDKRRRNTAASARFRLKKKEREAALDAKAQALEDRVSTLERECEALRRENGWLRGLVVGVTGGVVPNMTDVPIVAPSATTSSASSEKRKRDEQSA